MEATVGIEPTYEGFADPCLTTWLRRLKRTRGRPAASWERPGRPRSDRIGAGNGIRTRDPNLGKVVLYH